VERTVAAETLEVEKQAEEVKAVQVCACACVCCGVYICTSVLCVPALK
jgi:hypothetical protein